MMDIMNCHLRPKGDKYVPITSSCDSSCSLGDCGGSPSINNKVIHTPPPQYRGTASDTKNIKEGETCFVKSPTASHKESII